MKRLTTWNRIDKCFWRIAFSVVAMLMLVVVILLLLAVTTVEGAGHAEAKVKQRMNSGGYKCPGSFKRT